MIIIVMPQHKDLVKFRIGCPNSKKWRMGRNPSKAGDPYSADIFRQDNDYSSPRGVCNVRHSHNETS